MYGWMAVAAAEAGAGVDRKSGREVWLFVEAAAVRGAWVSLRSLTCGIL